MHVARQGMLIHWMMKMTTGIEKYSTHINLIGITVLCILTEWIY